jgi:hypothetical protein
MLARPSPAVYNSIYAGGAIPLPIQRESYSERFESCVVSSAVCPEVESEIRVFNVLNRLSLGGLFNPPGEAFQAPEYSGSLLVLSPRFVNGAHGKNIAVHS